MHNFSLLNKAMADHTTMVEKTKNDIQNIPIINEMDIIGATLEKPALDKSLELCKKQLDVIRKLKLNVDEVDRKGNEIQKYCENIRRQPPNIQEGVQELKKLWTQANNKLTSQVMFFDNIANHWQQIVETGGEINNWLDDIDDIIKESTENKKEIENGFMRLNKYNIELPSYINLKNQMVKKVLDMKKIENLDTMPQYIENELNKINERFNEVNEKVKGLENIAMAFTQEEKDFKLKLKVISENINKIREKVIECDDTTGETEKNVENLNRTSLIGQSLENNKIELDSLSASLKDLLQQFPSIKESILPKELENVKKRHEILTKNNEKNKKNLSNHIEKINKDKIISCSKFFQVAVELI